MCGGVSDMYISIDVMREQRREVNEKWKRKKRDGRDEELRIKLFYGVTLS